MHEKLIKVLDSFQYALGDYAGDNQYFIFDDHIKLATHLIENGVIIQQHSAWRLNRDGSGTCQHCHRTTKNVYDQDSWFRYCPDCGARMDGEPTCWNN